MVSKRLIKNTGLYFLGIFSTKILQLLFIPIYSKFLDPTDFGYYSLTVTIMALLIPLLYQSIWEGVLRFAIEKEGKEQKVLTTAIIYCFGLSILYIILFFIIYSYFNIQFGIAVLIMGISQIGVSYWQFSARALQKNKVFAISSVIHAITTILLNIILIMVFNWGLLALFIAAIVSNLISILILEVNINLIKSIRKADFNMDLLKSMVKYSFPLSINAAAWWLIVSFNILVITHKIGIDETGIYSMASRFGSIMTLVTTVVTMAWIEEAFRSYGSKESDKYFNTVLDLLTRVVFSAVVLLIPITYIFYQFFVFGDYVYGVILTPIIYLTAAYSALGSHLASCFLARKESDVVFRTTLIGGLVAAIGGYFVADITGTIGVAIASLFGFIVMCIIRIPMIRKRMKLKINYSLTIGMTVLCLITMYISNYNPTSLIHQIVIFVILLMLLIYINKNFLRYLFSEVKKRLYFK